MNLPDPPPVRGEALTRFILMLVMVSLVWMVARSLGLPAFCSESWEVGGTTALYAVALGAVCETAWRSTR